jgi:predicted RNA-binding protein YlqC (UPF0109 family)
MKKFEQQLLKNILKENVGNDEEKKVSSEQKRDFVRAVSEYHKLGEMIYRAQGLKEVAETLKSIVGTAENLTIEESEHWFDNVTVSRHMKQMNEAFKVFEKTATEMSGMQQRLEAAYEDMGTVLSKYYKVNEALR